MFTHQDPDTRIYHLGLDPDRTDAINYWEDNEEDVLVPNVDVEGKPVVYQGGKKYSIIITVYGLSLIKVDVIQALKWNDGGNITPID